MLSEEKRAAIKAHNLAVRDYTFTKNDFSRQRKKKLYECMAQKISFPELAKHYQITDSFMRRERIRDIKKEIASRYI